MKSFVVTFLEAHCLEIALQFTVFEFIWIQSICKFCLVYQLIDLDASR